MLFFACLASRKDKGGYRKKSNSVRFHEMNCFFFCEKRKVVEYYL